MNVLSLFDGISCAQVACERAGIAVCNYFASEIDKYALEIAMKNFPKIIQMGDIRGITRKHLPHINLLIGGSPCQGFSSAGKQLNFNDPRSKLFFEFVRVMKECRPDYFLLENVKMKKEYQDIISTELGTEPIEINSALVSAQSRKRLYWTNIPGIEQPEDRNIFLRDIIESRHTQKEKSYCLDADYYKGASYTQYVTKCRRQLILDVDFDVTERVKKKRQGTLAYEKAYKNARYLHEKAKTLTAAGQHISNTGATNIVIETDQGIVWRKLTPVECERLQTLPDNYTEGVSNAQRYKMLGNSFTADVIAHILRGVK